VIRPKADAGNPSFTRALTPLRPDLRVFATAVLILAASSLVASKAAAGTPSNRPLTRIGDVVAPGDVLAVASGAAPQKSVVYATVGYTAGSFDLIAFDPRTGAIKTFGSPLPGQGVAWALTPGPADTLYVGTATGADLVRVNLRSDVVTDLGSPEPGEQYIWGLTQYDGDIYGCTYPSAKLFRYDPATGQTTDLGRMDPTQEYARYCVAGDDGYIYVGIGTALDDVVAYNIATGAHYDLIPPAERATGDPDVFRATNGQVYTTDVNTTAGVESFLLQDGEAIPVAEAPSPASSPLLAQVEDALHKDAATDCSASSRKCMPLDRRYHSKPLQIFNIAGGPDGSTYVSTAMPATLTRIAPRGNLRMVGTVPAGEVYSTLRYGRDLLLATYAGNDASQLEIYDPSRPFAPGFGAGGNPRLETIQGETADWRPRTMIAGPGGLVYIGSVPGYGLASGAITVWDPANGAIGSYDRVIPSQSVTSLAMLPGSGGRYLVGGTSVAGGSGTSPVTDSADLFLWNTVSHTVTYDLQVPDSYTFNGIVPVSATSIVGLSSASQLVRLNLATGRLRVSEWPCGEALPGAAALRRGQIVVVSAGGICTVDWRTGRVRTLYDSPSPIVAGYVSASRVYFATSDTVYTYKLSSS
jgi:hypothetical protein